MKIVFYNMATAHEDWAEEASRIYSKKISHFMKFEVQHLRPKKGSREDADYKRNEESTLLLSHVKDEDYLILFDEQGKGFSSVEFSRRLETALGSSKKRLLFVIGGAFGVTEAVKKRADLKVSLSPMTMNHLVAQVTALEQIYRGFTIIKNIPYHNA